MRTMFYYVRDEKKRPMVTVCLKVSDTEVARGIAYCHAKMDIPNKKVGRQIAEGRAERALKHKKHLDVAHLLDNPEARMIMGDAIYKCAYNPTTTLQIEKKLIEAARKEAI